MRNSILACLLFLVSAVNALAQQPVNTTQIGGVALAFGQAAMAASIPVTIASNQSAIPVTGTFWQATQPVSGTFWQATQPVSGTFWQATQPISIADGSSVTLGAKADAKNSASDTTAISIMSVLKQISFSIQAAASSLAGTLTVGTHAVTESGTWTVQPGNTANTTPWLVSETPATSGGLSTCTAQSGTGTTASTNATNCKASAGQIYLIRAVNTTGTLAYLRMYNLTSAPTCSSATGFIESIPIPAQSTGAGFSFPQGGGQSYSTGIGFCVTGGGGNTDNTNAPAGAYITLLYK